MLAYGHSLSLDYQGFRPFSTDHREAAGPVGPAEAGVEVDCKLQTVPSCALATDRVCGGHILYTAVGDELT
jgi:hypothetical protein